MDLYNDTILGNMSMFFNLLIISLNELYRNHSLHISQERENTMC